MGKLLTVSLLCSPIFLPANFSNHCEDLSSLVLGTTSGIFGGGLLGLVVKRWVCLFGVVWMVWVVWWL